MSKLMLTVAYMIHFYSLKDSQCIFYWKMFFFSNLVDQMITYLYFTLALEQQVLWHSPLARYFIFLAKVNLFPSNSSKFRAKKGNLAAIIKQTPN